MGLDAGMPAESVSNSIPVIITKCLQTKAASPIKKSKIWDFFFLKYAQFSKVKVDGAQEWSNFYSALEDLI